MCVQRTPQAHEGVGAPRMHPNKFGTDGTNSITHFPIFFKGGVENFTLAPCSARNTMADAVRVWTWNYIKSNAAHAGEHKMQRFLGKYFWVRLSVCQEVFLLRFPECGIFISKEGELIVCRFVRVKSSTLSSEMEQDLYRLVGSGEYTPQEIAERILDWKPCIPSRLSKRAAEFKNVLEALCSDDSDNLEKMKEINTKMLTAASYYFYLVGYKDSEEKEL